METDEPAAAMPDHAPGVPTDARSPGAGRFAPSPSGDLHLGNLRTALLAWLHARGSGRRFLVRMEDLDRVRTGARARQLADLAALGIDHDGPVVAQSERTALYDAALDRLVTVGATFECYCTRREIQAAPTAPHAPPGAYPGTCRDLTEAERAERRASGRPAAIRLRSDVDAFTVHDVHLGAYTGVVDDFVLRRGDGVAAYNLAVVVDDAAQGVDQVVRGDDLLSSSPRQAYLATRLGLAVPEYAHVPLVLGPDGSRLAKRDGAVTLADRLARGETASDVLGMLAASAGLANAGEHVDLATLIGRWDPTVLSPEPWTLSADALGSPVG